jgi:hypothetical protein
MKETVFAWLENWACGTQLLDKGVRILVRVCLNSESVLFPPETVGLHLSVSKMKEGLKMAHIGTDGNFCRTGGVFSLDWMRKYNGEDRPEPGSQLSTFSCVPRAK